MSDHTPEPWTGDAQWVMSGPNGVIVAECIRDKDLPTGDGVGLVRNNVARIIACVNACAGINPEAVSDLVEALRKIETCGWTGVANTARAALAKAGVS